MAEVDVAQEEDVVAVDGRSLMFGGSPLCLANWRIQTHTQVASELVNFVHHVDLHDLRLRAYALLRLPEIEKKGDNSS